MGDPDFQSSRFLIFRPAVGAFLFLNEQDADDAEVLGSDGAVRSANVIFSFGSSSNAERSI